MECEGSEGCGAVVVWILRNVLPSQSASTLNVSIPTLGDHTTAKALEGFSTLRSTMHT
jgi:hypothetical protein